MRDFRVNKAKKLSKTNPDYRFLNGGVKVILNSLVGLFGNDLFHYADPSVFNAVTRMGQYMLYRLKGLLEEFGFKVIYGATDSVFFQSPFPEQETRGKIAEVIKIVKMRFKLDLEFETKFALVFFSGRKSNYIAITEDGKLEVKGLSATKTNNTQWIRNHFDEFTSKVSKMVPDGRSVEEIKEFTRNISSSLDYEEPKRKYEVGK